MLSGINQLKTTKKDTCNRNFLTVAGVFGKKALFQKVQMKFSEK